MMTAEETLKQTFLKYRGKKKNTYTLIDVEVEAMKEYARIQIEKDRERVKENVRCINEGNINGAGESEEYYAVDLASIDQTPIILD